jgi:hypothetical protein
MSVELEDQYVEEEWFVSPPLPTPRSIVFSSSPPPRKRPRLPDLSAKWLVKKSRESDYRADPRIRRYGQILGLSYVLSAYSQAISRLTLVLDLDLTLVETVKEEVLAGLPSLTQTEIANRSFRLPQLYVAKRTCLDGFLAVVSQYYDLWIYSHGQPEYVRQVVNKIDPTNAFFRNRIIAPLTDPSRSQAKSLDQIPGLQDKDLVLIFDDQPDVWNNDLCVIPSKMFSPSGSNVARSVISLSTFKEKYTFSEVPSVLTVTDGLDTQLESLAHALEETYLQFIRNGECNTASYEFSEVRRAVLQNERLSFESYIQKIGQEEAYTKQKYNLYHFAAMALGAAIEKDGFRVEERWEGDGVVSGNWLVQCFFHIQKLPMGVF